MDAMIESGELEAVQQLESGNTKTATIEATPSEIKRMIQVLESQL
ncbi:MAG: hypothetical protein R6U20_04110 [Longimonas sp.]